MPARVFFGSKKIFSRGPATSNRRFLRRRLVGIDDDVEKHPRLVADMRRKRGVEERFAERGYIHLNWSLESLKAPARSILGRLRTVKRCAKRSAQPRYVRR
jgi:hypothetical protein